MTQITLYADGACSGNPGPGGYAWQVLVDGMLEREGGDSAAHTTNNIMELTALRDGLVAAFEIACTRGARAIVLKLDSEYALKGLTEWLPNWKAKGWRTSGGKPVQNVELWKEVDAIAINAADAGVRLTPHWIKGHAGEAGNERVDQMACEYRDQAKAGTATTAAASPAGALSEPSPTLLAAIKGSPVKAPVATPAAAQPAPAEEPAPRRASAKQILALAALIDGFNEDRMTLDELHAALRRDSVALGLA